MNIHGRTQYFSNIGVLEHAFCLVEKRENHEEKGAGVDFFMGTGRRGYAKNGKIQKFFAKQPSFHILPELSLKTLFEEKPWRP